MKSWHQVKQIGEDLHFNIGAVTNKLMSAYGDAVYGRRWLVTSPVINRAPLLLGGKGRAKSWSMASRLHFNALQQASSNRQGIGHINAQRCGLNSGCFRSGDTLNRDFRVKSLPPGQAPHQSGSCEIVACYKSGIESLKPDSPASVARSRTKARAMRFISAKPRVMQRRASCLPACAPIAAPRTSQ